MSYKFVDGLWVETGFEDKRPRNNAQDIRLKHRRERYMGSTEAPIRSPIDGTMITSNAEMQRHCEKHDVVPTRELEGLTDRKFGNPYKVDRKQLRDDISRTIETIKG